MEEPIGLLSGVFCLLIYTACLIVFLHVRSPLWLVEVVHEPMECLGKTCMTKGRVYLV